MRTTVGLAVGAAVLLGASAGTAEEQLLAGDSGIRPAQTTQLRLDLG